MEKIYEVTIDHAYDYKTYYVVASDVGNAAYLALQADATTEYGADQKVERSKPGGGRLPKVACVREFCNADQFVK